MTIGDASTALSLLSVAAVATVALLTTGDAMPPIAGPGISVVDGDTVDFDGRRWRLVGYDTPEIFHAHCPRERHLAIIAAARLVSLVEAGATLDPVDGRDKYGRGLARLLDASGRDAAATLVSEGHARAYDGKSKRQGWCD